MQRTLDFSKKRKLESSLANADCQDVIKCPVCCLNLSNFELYHREYHVDACVSGTALVQSEVKFEEQEDGVIVISDDEEVVESGDVEIRTMSGVRLPSSSSSFPNSITKPRSTPFTKSKTISKVKRQPVAKPKTEPKQKPLAPFFKTITFKLTSSELFRVNVDGFNYSYKHDINIHFLSHFHSDHYIGITKKWFNTNPGSSIYCSDITRRLMIEKFNLNEEHYQDMVKSLPIEWETLFESDEHHEFIKVKSLHANHCPGGSIFLFRHFILKDDVEVTIKMVLHCGDFRVSRNMIQSLSVFEKIHEIYLDTTYLNPIYLFIEQNSLVKKTGLYLKKKFGDEKSQKKKNSILNYFTTSVGDDNSSWVLLIGTYSIGKENLYLRLSEYLDTKILINVEKFKMLRNFIPFQDLLEKFVVFDTNLKKFKDGATSYEIDESFKVFSLNHVNKTKELRCLIHLLPIGKLSDKLFLSRYYQNKKIIKIKPTGWSFRNFTKSIPKLSEYDNDDQKLEFLSKIIRNDERFEDFNDIIDGMLKFKNEIYLPYSEHSNFKELSLFCCCLNWDRIIPTVNNHYQRDIRSDDPNRQHDNEFEKWFRIWKEYEVDWKCIEDYFIDEPR